MSTPNPYWDGQRWLQWNGQEWEPMPMAPPPSQKTGSSAPLVAVIIALVAVLVLVVAGGGIWLISRSSGDATPPVDASISATPDPTDAQTPPQPTEETPSPEDSEYADQPAVFVVADFLTAIQEERYEDAANMYLTTELANYIGGAEGLNPDYGKLQGFEFVSAEPTGDATAVTFIEYWEAGEQRTTYYVVAWEGPLLIGIVEGESLNGEPYRIDPYTE